MKIAITGASGQLGQELVRLGCIPLRGRLMSEEMTQAIETYSPDAIINCAAMTDVDGCEKNIMGAAATNAGGVDFLSYRFSGYLIQISTDYIFDGQGGLHYTVNSSPNPINIYGWSKLGGELALQRHKGPGLIVRTTILFGQHYNNFVSKILEGLERGPKLRLFNPELVGTPTYTPQLAIELMRLIEAEYQGIAHVAGNRFMTRLEFARRIAETFGYDPNMIIAGGAPPNQAAPRPLKAGLICDHSQYKPINSHDPLNGLKALAAIKKEC